MSGGDVQRCGMVGRIVAKRSGLAKLEYFCQRLSSRRGVRLNRK